MLKEKGNVINGRGVLQLMENDETQVECRGDFVRYNLNGLGSKIFYDGGNKLTSSYVGEFKDNLLVSGEWCYYYKSTGLKEMSIIGKFVNNNPHEECEVTTYDEMGQVIDRKIVVFNHGEKIKEEIIR